MRALRCTDQKCQSRNFTIGLTHIGSSTVQAFYQLCPVNQLQGLKKLAITFLHLSLVISLISSHYTLIHNPLLLTYLQIPHPMTVSDSVNRGMSTARRAHASLYDWIVYKRGSKAREREEKNSSAARYFMRPSSHVTRVCHNPRLPRSTVFHQRRNSAILYLSAFRSKC